MRSYDVRRPSNDIGGLSDREFEILARLLADHKGILFAARLGTQDPKSRDAMVYLAQHSIDLQNCLKRWLFWQTFWKFCRGTLPLLLAAGAPLLAGLIWLLRQLLADSS